MDNNALALPFGIFTNDNTPVDAKYFKDFNTLVTPKLPYASVAEANTILIGGIGGLRHLGLTVNIAGVEYCYKNGIADVHLVVKASGSTPLGKLKITDFDGAIITDLASSHAWILTYFVGSPSLITNESFFDGSYYLDVPIGSDFSLLDNFCADVNIQVLDPYGCIGILGGRALGSNFSGNSFVLKNVTTKNNFLRDSSGRVEINQLISTDNYAFYAFTGVIYIYKDLPAEPTDSTFFFLGGNATLHLNRSMTSHSLALAAAANGANVIFDL